MDVHFAGSPAGSRRSRVQSRARVLLESVCRAARDTRSARAAREDEVLRVAAVDGELEHAGLAPRHGPITPIARRRDRGDDFTGRVERERMSRAIPGGVQSVTLNTIDAE